MWICFSLLDAVMREPFNMGQDDVTVMNRPASSNVYQTLHPPNIAGDDEMWNQNITIFRHQSFELSWTCLEMSNN